MPLCLWRESRILNLGLFLFDNHSPIVEVYPITLCVTGDNTGFKTLVSFVLIGRAK